MVKKDLIQKVADATNQPIKQVEATISAFIDVVSNLDKGDKLSIVGFGTFTNAPVTEKTHSIGGHHGVTPAHHRLKFKSSKQTKN